MKFFKQFIEGVYEVVAEPNIDDRGFFMRTYDKKIFKEMGLDRKWVQENQSYTRHKGTIRGFHFQLPPYCETKLIRIIKGKVLLTVIDLRNNSKTFGKWLQILLSESKKNMIYVPRGCATGSCILTTNCHFAYKVDNYYVPGKEGQIKWNDPDLAVKWPIKKPSLISDKDRKAPSFKEFKERYHSLSV